MAIANKIKLSDGTVIDLASGGLVLGETSGTAYEGSKGKKNADDIITLQDDVANLTTGKQDKLVSGTNIKTINGTSLLGSGDIVIQGGGDIPIASATTLGGVKVGNGLKIDTQGTLSVDVATNTEIDALFN